MRIDTTRSTPQTRALTVYQRPRRRCIRLQPIERTWPCAAHKAFRHKVHGWQRRDPPKGQVIDVFV